LVVGRNFAEASLDEDVTEALLPLVREFNVNYVGGLICPSKKHG
jgi:hypothetical protein